NAYASGGSRTSAAAELHRRQLGVAEVAVHVAAVQPGQRPVAYHVAARDRAVAGAVRMGQARPHGAGCGTAAEAARALEHVPAVVGPPARAAASEVDLLERVLA